MPGEKSRNLGVSISRTLVPTLPADYLSRKHLFPLIDNSPSGTTFLIAPDGYGKTSLVAEWAQNQSRKVIWMTVTNNDSLNEMSAMMIIATRQVIPGFAPWFEKDHPMRPTELVRRWGNELLETGENYVYVLDNLINEDRRDVDIEVQLLEQFPKNLHFIAIRRDKVDQIYGICAARGPIKVVSINDLRFSEEEIELVASNLGVDISDKNRAIVKAAHGWPAATSLLLNHIHSHGIDLELENLMSSSIEPLRALVMLVIKDLDARLTSICEKLAIVETFTLEQAKLILGDEFSVDLIHSIAHKGEIFTLSRNPEVGYVFSPMVRQIFFENLRKKPKLKNELHQKLITHFQKVGNQSEALLQAFESGDERKISELFPLAVRTKLAQGRGGEILRWATHIGASERVDSILKKSTVLVAGFIADLNFTAAQSELNRINLLAEESQGREFFYQFTAAASCYSLLSLGKFVELEDAIRRTKIGTEECLLGIDGEISLLRLQATSRYIFNDLDGVGESYALAEKLAKQTAMDTSHTAMMAIESMWLHQRGEYRRAYEVATIALNQHQRLSFVGNHGPLDVMYVIARTLLEFSRTTEALSTLEQLRNKAFQWKQWHWFFAADNQIIQHFTYSGNHKEALERIKRARDFVATLEPTNQLSTIIDINEMNIRRNLKDFDRLEKLVNRAPVTRDTQQFKMAVDEFRGRKVIAENAKNLPDKYPRDLIWKYLTEASLNLKVEKIALSAMHKALKVGAEVGAKESFLRQRDEMGNLIIRIANDYPTIYNEEIASAMADRIKERGSNMTTAQVSLTKREQEILRQLSTGRTLTVIAEELHISQNTMKTHLKNLYKKMGAEGRHDAVEKAKSTFLI